LGRRKGATAQPVTYDGGWFVAVDYYYDHFLTSIDGADWLEQGLEVPNYLFGIAYGNGRFVALGWAGLILTSVTD
jgi:hypothetical protein